MVQLPRRNGGRGKKRSTADGLYARLAELADPERRDSNLPETIELNQDTIDKYWSLWLWWVATERKFLPSQLLCEPFEPFAVMLEIDNLYEKIVEQLRPKEVPE